MVCSRISLFWDILLHGGLTHEQRGRAEIDRTKEQKESRTEKQKGSTLTMPSPFPFLLAVLTTLHLSSASSLPGNSILHVGNWGFKSARVPATKGFWGREPGMKNKQKKQKVMSFKAIDMNIGKVLTENIFLALWVMATVEVFFCVLDTLVTPIFAKVGLTGGLITPDDTRRGIGKELVKASIAAGESMCNVGRHSSFKLRIIDTKVVNAAAIGGFFLRPNVVITRGLLELRLPTEVNAAILLHEIGHIQKSHLPFRMGLYTCLITAKDVFRHLIEFGFGKRSEAGNPNSWLKNEASNPNSWLKFALNLAQSHVMMCFSRCNEFEADAYAGDAIGENAMILALQALEGVHPLLVHLQWRTGCVAPSLFFRGPSSRLGSVVSGVNHFFWPATHPATVRRMCALEERRGRKRAFFSEGNLLIDQ